MHIYFFISNMGKQMWIKILWIKHNTENFKKQRINSWNWKYWRKTSDLNGASLLEQYKMMWFKWLSWNILQDQHHYSPAEILHIERFIINHEQNVSVIFCLIKSVLKGKLYTKNISTSWLHRASNNVETFLLPTDAHNVKKHRVIKTF